MAFDDSSTEPLIASGGVAVACALVAAPLTRFSGIDWQWSPVVMIVPPVIVWAYFEWRRRE